MRRINILLVLDTLKADSFGAITRWGDFSQVMAGIEAAERVGFNIKLNVVKGVNEDEYDDLIRFAHRRGMDLTLNETMPMGEIERRGRETTSSQCSPHRVAASQWARISDGVWARCSVRWQTMTASYAFAATTMRLWFAGTARVCKDMSSSCIKLA